MDYPLAREKRVIFAVGLAPGQLLHSGIDLNIKEEPD
jgi:hypothetical protein